MYIIVGTIANFDRKKSYKGFLKSPVKVETVNVIKVNKCIINTVIRKKTTVNKELVLAKKEFKASPSSKVKPRLLVSNKLK